MTILSSINAVIAAHPYVAASVATLLVANAISAMPAPNGTSGKFYRWVFVFLHSINLPRLLATVNPGLAAQLKMMPAEEPANQSLSATAGK